MLISFPWLIIIFILISKFARQYVNILRRIYLLIIHEISILLVVEALNVFRKYPHV